MPVRIDVRRAILEISRMGHRVVGRIAALDVLSIRVTLIHDGIVRVVIMTIYRLPIWYDFRRNVRVEEDVRHDGYYRNFAFDNYITRNVVNFRNTNFVRNLAAAFDYYFNDIVVDCIHYYERKSIIYKGGKNYLGQTYYQISKCYCSYSLNSSNYIS